MFVFFIYGTKQEQLNLVYSIRLLVFQCIQGSKHIVYMHTPLVMEVGGLCFCFMHLLFSAGAWTSLDIVASALSDF